MSAAVYCVAVCSDTPRKRELYRDTELLRMDFCDEVSERLCRLVVRRA